MSEQLKGGELNPPAGHDGGEKREPVKLEMDEGFSLKVAYSHDLWVLLRRLRREGFERHPADKWEDCSDHTFNQLLMWFFLFTLSLAVLHVILCEYSFRIMSYGGYLSWLSNCLKLFAIIVLLAFLAKTVMKKITTTVLTSVETTSGAVLHV